MKEGFDKMKKKTACLIVIILLIVFLVLCFMPIVFNESYWKITDSWGSRSHMFDKPKDILSTCQEDFAIAVISLSAIGIVAFILRFASKEGKLLTILSFAPTAALIAFVILTIKTVLLQFDMLQSHTEYGLNWGFYIVAALLLFASLISFLVAIGKINKGEAPQKNSVESADELEKYKKLLDRGIITQAEYNAKKKQLLDL